MFRFRGSICRLWRCAFCAPRAATPRYGFCLFGWLRFCSTYAATCSPLAASSAPAAMATSLVCAVERAKVYWLAFVRKRRRRKTPARSAAADISKRFAAPRPSDPPCPALQRAASASALTLLVVLRPAAIPLSRLLQNTTPGSSPAERSLFLAASLPPAAYAALPRMPTTAAGVGVCAFNAGCNDCGVKRFLRHLRPRLPARCGACARRCLRCLRTVLITSPAVHLSTDLIRFFLSWLTLCSASSPATLLATTVRCGVWWPACLPRWFLPSSRAAAVCTVAAVRVRFVRYYASRLTRTAR